MLDPKNMAATFCNTASEKSAHANNPSTRAIIQRLKRRRALSGTEATLAML